MPNISVVMPALNEEEVIGKAIGDIPRDIVAEVVVVDNGSSDGTAAVAKRAGARVINEPKRGYGRACLAGVRAVSPQCDIIVLMDSDGSDDPSEIPMLVDTLFEGDYDLVLGSRMLGNREGGSMTRAQVLGSWLAPRLIKLLYGARYTDMGPFRAIRKESLDNLAMSQMTYGWSIEMQVKAAARGLRVQEVPVRWRNRAGGKSKVAGSYIGAMRAASRICWTVIALWISERRRQPVSKHAGASN